MTSVKFLTDGKSIYGFAISGHSSVDCDDNAGKIVCAAVSSAAYMAANTIIEIIGDNCDADIGEASMLFSVKNPSSSAVAVLEGFRLHIKQLSKQYGSNIKYTEVHNRAKD